MGRRWYTKDSFMEAGHKFFYVGRRKTRKQALALVDREKRKAGKVKLLYRLKKVGNYYRVYVARVTDW